MALTLQQIITEADILVPNAVSTADKVIQLSSINADFFSNVKITKVHRFSSTTAGAVTLPTDIRQKNIDLLQIGPLRYRSLDDSSSPGPLECFYSFDDTIHVLTLSPAPYKAGLDCLCRHRRIATTTFTTSNLSATPDAPEEYHWTYILALAAWLASVMMLTEQAASYETRYRQAWQRANGEFSAGAVTGT
ncbi:hypothetical protein D3C72_245120 [compost metagenome]